MIKKLKPKSEFMRNVLILMTGTTIAQAIPIAISPILTRLYTPEDFGVLALFVAITSIFGSIANGRYELAIMLPQKDEDAINIMALGFIINVALSLSLLFIVIVMHDNILDLLNNKKVSTWLYWVPLSVFLLGCFNLLNYYNNRKRFYKDLAKANIYKSIGMVIVQLSLGLLKTGAAGLISGQLFSQIILNIKLILNVKNLNLLSRIKKVKIIALGKEYINFPKYSVGGVLANTLSQQLINILISSLYGIKTLGFYNLSQRILGIPLGLIGCSISQIFFERAVQEKHKTQGIVKTYIFTIKILILISIPTFTTIYFISEDLFTFVFGERWRMAGEYARLLVPLFAIRLIVSSISPIYDIFNAIRIELLWQVLLLTGYILIFITCYHKYDFTFVLEKIVLFGTCMYIFSFLIISWIVFKVKGGRNEG